RWERAPPPTAPPTRRDNHAKQMGPRVAASRKRLRWQTSGARPQAGETRHPGGHPSSCLGLGRSKRAGREPRYPPLWSSWAYREVYRPVVNTVFESCGNIDKEETGIL